VKPCRSEKGLGNQKNFSQRKGSEGRGKAGGSVFQKRRMRGTKRRGASTKSLMGKKVQVLRSVEMGALGMKRSHRGFRRDRAK